MATHTTASSLVFAALTPARILLTISTLLWKKGVLILSETMRKTCERKVYFSGTLKSNRSLQICNHRSLEKLRFFKVVCLIELAKIVECIEETKLTVLPIFYHVDPSHVRNQTGTLAEAFEKHEKDPKVNKEDVQAWKAALKEVGNISGWHLNDR